MKTSHTDREWEKWGRRNPYLGVLGFETQSVLTDSTWREKFFGSGEEHIARIISTAEAHFGPITPNRALDFGCGVGRLLMPLSNRFKEVCGVDISSSMLEQARTNLSSRPHVNLVRTLDDAAGEFDFVHSSIVLQHIRPQQGMGLINRLLQITAPGGIFALHTTIGDLRWKRRMLNMMRYRVRPVHWVYNIVRRRPLNEPITEMNRYDAAALFDLYRSIADEPLVVQTIDQDRYVGLMVIGRASDKRRGGERTPTAD